MNNKAGFPTCQESLGWRVGWKALRRMFGEYQHTLGTDKMQAHRFVLYHEGICLPVMFSENFPHSKGTHSHQYCSLEGTDSKTTPSLDKLANFPREAWNEKTKQKQHHPRLPWFSTKTSPYQLLKWTLNAPIGYKHNSCWGLGRECIILFKCGLNFKDLFPLNWER